MTPDGLPADFRLNGKAFDPVRFFSGKFMAQGMFVDRFGSVQRRLRRKLIAAQMTTKQNYMKPLFMMMARQNSEYGPSPKTQMAPILPILMMLMVMPLVGLTGPPLNCVMISF